jgi:hypothetical protein
MWGTMLITLACAFGLYHRFRFRENAWARDTISLKWEATLATNLGDSAIHCDH